MPRLYLTIAVLTAAILLPSLGGATVTPPTIDLPNALHFTDSDGKDRIIGPGTYRVEVQKSHLRLTPAEGNESLVVTALPIPHDESVSMPVAMVVAEEGNDDQAHIVLLLPEHTGLEAVGSLSGVATRATSFSSLSRVQIQRAYSQQTQPGEASPNRLAPIKVAPVVTPAPPQNARRSGPGQLATWNYLYMHRPEMVAKMLADVQTGKLPPTTISGLASPMELTEILKTNWSAEAAKLAGPGNAAMNQPGITSRAVPNVLAPAPPVVPSIKDMPVMTAPPLAALTPIPIALSPIDLGAHWSGERGTYTYSMTVPAAGSFICELDASLVNARVKILEARSYTGLYANGMPVVANKVDNCGAPLPVFAGQRVEVVLAYDVDPGLGPPVGKYAGALTMKGLDTSRVRWVRTAAVRIESLGINLGILAYAPQGTTETLTDRTVELPLVVTNAMGTPWSGMITPVRLPQGVSMPPVPVSFTGAGRQTVPLRFQVTSAAKDGAFQTVIVQVTGGTYSRTVRLDLTIVHPVVVWEQWFPPKTDPDDVRYFRSTMVDHGLWIVGIGLYSERNKSYLNCPVQLDSNPAVKMFVDERIFFGKSGYQSYEFESSLSSPWIKDNFVTAATAGFSWSCKIIPG